MSVESVETADWLMCRLGMRHWLGSMVKQTLVTTKERIDGVVIVTWRLYQFKGVLCSLEPPLSNASVTVMTTKYS